MTSVVSMGVQTELAVAFESTWGSAAASGYRLLKFNKMTFGVTQNIEKTTVLGVGRGREGNEINLGAITDTGTVEVPLDAADIGFWTKLFFGTPATSVGYHKATGGITFSQQPANNSTITINGVTWTFVTGTAVGNQTQISAVNLAGTLTSLAANLTTYAGGTNALTGFTFSATTTKLSFSTPVSAGAAGNAYTYSAGSSPASNGTVDGAKMTGGTHKHTWNSGADTLPSATVVIAHLRPSAFETHVGVMADTWAQTLDPKAPHGNVTIGLVGQTSSWAGTEAISPDLATARREDEFTTFECNATKNGAAFGGILGATINFNNNLDSPRCLNDDGMISDSVPGMFDASGTLKIRFTDRTLITNATETTPIALAFTWNDINNVGGLNAFQLLMNEVYLSMPKVPIDGPAGLACDFNWTARSLAAYSVTVVLVNQYTYA